MPLLASFIGVLFSGLTSVFGAFFALAMARKFAAYTVLITVFGAFLATTFVCVSSLWTMATGYFSNSGGMGSIAGAMAIGLGIIIPANAATVLSCCSSVWIACQVYKIQKAGLMTFAH